MTVLKRVTPYLWLPVVAVVLFLTAAIFRPLFPIDETRYMSVAWEMRLHDGWLSPLTKNFEPYHHKPPLLFWLINLFWSVFGVSRWAGLLPFVLASFSCVVMTAVLGRKILTFGQDQPKETFNRVMLIMAASVPFLAYGTLVMFDFLLCSFVLAALIFVVRFAENRKVFDLVMIGLMLGVGILAKGPVALLYVLPVYLLAPVWKPELDQRGRWYAALVPIILISALPVLLWLIPVLQATDNQFAFWLVWNQTAGRVTGNFSDAHVRPFFFYLPILPALIIPWIFFPKFWRSVRQVLGQTKTDHGLKFLICWFVPVFVAFSVISGKQPHYMVPLVPALVLMLAYLLRQVSTRTLAMTLIVMVTLFVGGQMIASRSVFRSYDLTPVGKLIMENPGHPLVFVQNYHAELGFIARLETPVDDITHDKLPEWFAKNPDGWAIVKYKDIKKLGSYPVLMTMPYRGGKLAVLGWYGTTPSLTK